MWCNYCDAVQEVANMRCAAKKWVIELHCDALQYDMQEMMITEQIGANENNVYGKNWTYDAIESVSS